ncbi:MAG: tRNA adenosine(34) deaminase TadA [Gammaproteobacteria bacterium]|nr:tRNA adenosine(34) deaminase TadA [Gammaproteobacteria bacterium]
MRDDADAAWMREALDLAARGAEAGEVPVGCVIVRDGEVVGRGWNRPIGSHDPTAHAEVVALREAAARLENYRLVGTTLYVTLEPCVMCVGAIVHARVERLVYGAADPKTGAIESAFALLEGNRHNHRVAVTGGVLADACGEMLRAFFRARRVRTPAG